MHNTNFLDLIPESGHRVIAWTYVGIIDRLGAKHIHGACNIFVSCYLEPFHANEGSYTLRWRHWSKAGILMLRKRMPTPFTHNVKFTQWKPKYSVQVHEIASSPATATIAVQQPHVMVRVVGGAGCIVFEPLCLQRPSAVGSRLRSELSTSRGDSGRGGTENEAMSTEVGGSW